MSDQTPRPDPVPAEWRSILRRGERIVWQGAPANDEPFVKQSATNVLMGLAAMIIIPIIIARNAGGTGSPSAFLWIIGILMMGFACWQTFGRSAFASYRLRHSFYTLTTRRAFTGWMLWGRRRLDIYDITVHSKIEYQPGRLGSVYFAEKIHHSEHSNWTEKIGFLNIPDAEKVFDLIQKVQKGEA